MSESTIEYEGKKYEVTNIYLGDLITRGINPNELIYLLDDTRIGDKIPEFCCDELRIRGIELDGLFKRNTKWFIEKGLAEEVVEEKLVPGMILYSSRFLNTDSEYREIFVTSGGVHRGYGFPKRGPYLDNVRTLAELNDISCWEWRIKE